MAWLISNKTKYPYLCNWLTTEFGKATVEEVFLVLTSNATCNTPVTKEQLIQFSEQEKTKREEERKRQSERIKKSKEQLGAAMAILDEIVSRNI
jgi:hypothetical protein